MSDIKHLRHRCFFDISIGSKNVGRVVFELYNDICPRTCDNFKFLCTGEKGMGKTTGKPLHYKNTIFHRVVKNFIIQSGDFSMGNGRGGESIFGGTFNDENFDIKHDKPFLLSMANRGKNTNGSQFFITLSPAPHLDGVHVVFGHVLSGQEIIAEVENQPIGEDCRPLVDVVISNCGELIPQIKPKDKKKKHRKDKTKKSDGELSSEEEEKDVKESKDKKKKDKKHKKHKKSKDESDHKKDEEKKENKETDEQDVECSVRPDEIPDIPANNFLMRKIESEKDEKVEDTQNEREELKTSSNSYGRRMRNPPISRSGRKIKGRGFRRYRTPTPEHQRSGSETPPHWRSAQSRLKSLKEVITEKQRSDGRDIRTSDRSRFESRRNYRQRYENENYMNRDFNRSERSERPQRESWDNEETFSRQRTADRESSGRKRIFTEEPPSHKRAKRSTSPKQSSDRQSKQHNEDTNEKTRVGASNAPNLELIKYPERKETTHSTDKHFVKSEVKLNEDFESKRNRTNNGNNSSRDKYHSERRDKRHNESPFDLKDIPLPNSNDSIKRNSSERQHRNRSERSDSDSKNNKRSKREDKGMRSHSRDKHYSSQKKLSSGRHHSSDSASNSSVSSNQSQNKKISIRR